MPRQEALEAENAELRRRVALLEDELAEQAKRANLAVAVAQDRLYWLDRWHIDLNAVMRRPGAMRARALAKVLRAPIRRIRHLRHALLGR
jgi:hypothetical protein